MTGDVRERGADARHAAKPRVQRRTLIASALWTAPVILVGAAAPAEAASTSIQPAQLAFNSLNTTGTAYDGTGKPTGLQTQVQVQNVYYASAPSVSATVQKVTVLVRFPTSQAGTAGATAVSGTGWTYVGTSTSGGNRVLTFTWTGSIAPGEQTSLLQFSTALRSTSAGQRTLTATASATNATDANGSTSYTVS